MATHFIENAIVEKSCLVSIENRKKKSKNELQFQWSSIYHVLPQSKNRKVVGLYCNTLFNENINTLVHNVGVVTGSESKWG